ncbi:MAG: hypothetical protein L3J07_01470 [Candidatus Magasanikbacteria bacterium]|nr:hypothetical protein [Candidatus Magasanikbacteria bacterium]
MFKLSETAKKIKNDLVNALGKISDAIDKLDKPKENYTLIIKQIKDALNYDGVCQIRFIAKKQIFETLDKNLSKFFTITISPINKVEVDISENSVLFLYTPQPNKNEKVHETLSFNFCDIHTITVKYFEF